MNDKKHITKTDLNSFNNNTMLPEEKEAFLEHIGSCTFCSDQFAAFLSDDLITAPIDLKSNILRAVRHEQRITHKVKEVSKRMQLIIYSLKVGAATTLALLMLLLSVNLSELSAPKDNIPVKEPSNMSQKVNVPITSVIRDGMDSICNDILDFSNTLIRNN